MNKRKETLKTKPSLVRLLFMSGLLVLSALAFSQQDVSIENDHFKVSVSRGSGVISSLLVKKNNSELVAEPRLAANFRINLQLKDNLANYIDGAEQKAKSVSQKGNVITVSYSGMKSPIGTYNIDLTYTITLTGDQLSFKSKLTNKDKNPVSEFWFPRIGGIKEFGQNREARLAVPTYNTETGHNLNLFKEFPGQRRLGAEGAEFSTDYMYVTMPWWDIYDQKSDMGLYLGYHDTVCRVSTMHTYLMPDMSGSSDAWLTKEGAAGKPVGLIFSHVRFPFIKAGETLESGEFIVHAHRGDWHAGTQVYRKWFMSHFPFDHSNSWLRKKRMWFSSIIYQPEDRIVTDFKGFNQWTKEAKEYGITCHELIGWNNGGLERNYPNYTPEEKIGGNTEFKKLLASIKARGDKCLVFTNYNILDENTAWYKRDLHKYMAQNQHGKQAIGMGWGESTLLARKGLDVRYHVRASVVPGLRKILDDQFVQLVRDGAQGLQMDKVISGAALDFNPLNTLKPDVALMEGLVDAIASLNKQCKKVDPAFEMAGESGTDRFLPYFPVTYRNAKAHAISSLRYVFPEWTSATHIFYPRDFRGINAAIMNGAVICIEPEEYQGSLKQPIYKDLAEYLQETDRIREELNDLIFMAKFYDNQGAFIHEISSAGALLFKVHGHNKTDQRTIVVANNKAAATTYTWKFLHKDVKQALLYAPFEKVRIVNQGDTLSIKPEGVNILVEITDNQNNR
jgi:hypothetical protein